LRFEINGRHIELILAGCTKVAPLVKAACNYLILNNKIPEFRVYLLCLRHQNQRGIVDTRMLVYQIAAVVMLAIADSLPRKGLPSTIGAYENVPIEVSKP